MFPKYLIAKCVPSASAAWLRGPIVYIQECFMYGMLFEFWCTYNQRFTLSKLLFEIFAYLSYLLIVDKKTNNSNNLDK